MEQSPLNGSMIRKPLSDEADSPLVRDTSENIIIKCQCGKHVTRPVDYGHRYFRSRWLQKIFDLLNRVAD